MRGFNGRNIDYGLLTEKGRTAQAAYSESDSPASICIPHTAPFLAVLPYLNEIEVSEDSVIIRSEFFSVDRIVYMDGRGHPDNGEQSNQGHSIGWWEDDVLVVDTTNFADHRLGNLEGVPLRSGEASH